MAAVNPIPPPPPQWQQPAWQQPLAPNGRPLASFGDRLLAYLIDVAIFVAISLVTVVPVMIVGVILMVAEIERTNSPAIAFIIYFVMVAIITVISLIFTYLYYVEYQLRNGGQTVGKKAMRLWVVPVVPTEQLTRLHLLKRWAVSHVVGVFVPFFNYLDGLWQLWDKPLQQCLHDKAAATVVIKVG